MPKVKYDTSKLKLKPAHISKEDDSYLYSYKINFSRFVRQCIKKLRNGDLKYNHAYEPLDEEE